MMYKLSVLLFYLHTCNFVCTSFTVSRIQTRRGLSLQNTSTRTNKSISKSTSSSDRQNEFQTNKDEDDSSTTTTTSTINNGTISTISYEKVNSRQRILDLRVFRGFSISAEEYIIQQQQQEQQQLSKEEAIKELTLSYDDYGRDLKLLEYYKKMKNTSSFDNHDDDCDDDELLLVKHFIAIASSGKNDDGDRKPTTKCTDETNSVIGCIDAQIKQQLPQEQSNEDNSNNNIIIPYPHVSLKNLFIDPQYRRQGIASKLIQKVKEYTKWNNIQYIILEVDPSNDGAIRLYKKEGFGFVSDNGNDDCKDDDEKCISGITSSSMDGKMILQLDS